MTNLTRYGCDKQACAEMGIAKSTMSELVRRAKHRIGARTRLLAILEWDRWNREQERASA